MLMVVSPWDRFGNNLRYQLWFDYDGNWDPGANQPNLPSC
jgi:hypothetical protein